MTRLTLNPVPPVLDVAGFAAGYTSEVIRCLDAILPDLPRVLPRLLEAVHGERGTIYLLGNGGSSAIARTLALTAMNVTGSSGGGVRWVGAWEPHRIAAESSFHGFDAAAAGLLRRDGADRRDLVVLISGSGNSANLVAVAQHCHHRGIPLITLTGRTGGALAPFDPDGLRVDSTDQQVIEDVAHAAGLALLHLLAATQRIETNAASDVLERGWPELTRALMINQPWLQSLCEATAASAGRGGRIIVLAPEGGGVALSAEHTAHNLRWDLGHDNHRARLRVVDGTSLCDDTGMSNDTGTCGLAAARLLDDVTSDDLILIFADDPDHPTVRPARTAARATTHGPTVFGCYRTSTNASPHETVWRTGVNGALAALTAQTAGHLLLRGVRAATLLLDDDRSLDPHHFDTAWQPVAPQHARTVP